MTTIRFTRRERARDTLRAILFEQGIKAGIHVEPMICSNHRAWVRVYAVKNSDLIDITHEVFIVLAEAFDLEYCITAMGPMQFKSIKLDFWNAEIPVQAPGTRQHETALRKYHKRTRELKELLLEDLYRG